MTKLLFLATLTLSLLGGICFAQDKIVAIQATARGQGNQEGMSIGTNVTLESYSSAEDRNALWEAFNSGGEQALVKALVAMPARGHLSFAGVAEYEIAYIRVFPVGNGRKVRLIARRPLAFGDTRRYQSVNYLIAAVEFDLVPAGGKSTGTFVPACDLSITKTSDVEIVTYQSAWLLDSIITHTK